MAKTISAGRVAIFLLVAGLALGACGGSGGGGSGGSSNAGGGGGATGKTATISGSNIEIKLEDNFFSPSTLVGKPGQKVTIELDNEGSAEHNFSLDSQKIDQNVQSGDKAEVTVTLPKSGVLPFYCEFHKSIGMTGQLKVK